MSKNDWKLIIVGFVIKMSGVEKNQKLTIVGGGGAGGDDLFGSREYTFNGEYSLEHFFRVIVAKFYF